MTGDELTVTGDSAVLSQQAGSALPPWLQGAATGGRDTAVDPLEVTPDADLAEAELAEADLVDAELIDADLMEDDDLADEETQVNDAPQRRR
jgi:hypothetical protein